MKPQVGKSEVDDGEIVASSIPSSATASVGKPDSSPMPSVNVSEAASSAKASQPETDECEIVQPKQVESKKRSSPEPCGQDVSCFN